MDTELAQAVKNERLKILEYVDQLQRLHTDNRSAVVILDFLKDLIRNRGQQ